MEEYKSIVRSIISMENSDGQGNPWYSEDYYCLADDELMKRFPNVSFSKKYYERYKAYRQTKDENENLKQSNQDLQQKIEDTKARGPSQSR